MNLNILVFFSWIFSSQQEDGFMARNFLVSWLALREGRVWTLLTSVFSHISVFHFLINMFVLRSFGPIIERSIGSTRYWRFYLVAGTIASLSHSLLSVFLMNEPQQAALGASGAISGVVFLFAFLYPREKILLLGLIPIPAIWGALLILGLDLWGMAQQARGGGLPIGYGAHIGGALTGIFYYFLVLRRFLPMGRGL